MVSSKLVRICMCAVAAVTLALVAIACDVEQPPVTYIGVVTAIEDGGPPGEVYVSAIFIDGKKVTVWPVPKLIIGRRYSITVQYANVLSAELLP